MKETANIFYSNTNSVNLYVFKSNFNSVYALEMLLKKIKKQISLPSPIYCNICISVIEAISNAIIHGNKFDKEKKVYLFVQFKPNDWICFTIKDEGCGFDFENMPESIAETNEKRPYGRGLYFMKNLSNRTFFSEKGTAVDLHFKLRGT